jgi:hypothetical protein
MRNRPENPLMAEHCSSVPEEPPFVEVERQWRHGLVGTEAVSRYLGQVGLIYELEDWKENHAL